MCGCLSLCSWPNLPDLKRWSGSRIMYVYIYIYLHALSSCTIVCIRDTRTLCFDCLCIVWAAQIVMSAFGASWDFLELQEFTERGIRELWVRNFVFEARMDRVGSTWPFCWGSWGSWGFIYFCPIFCPMLRLWGGGTWRSTRLAAESRACRSWWPTSCR